MFRLNASVFIRAKVLLPLFKPTYRWLSFVHILSMTMAIHCYLCCFERWQQKAVLISRYEQDHCNVFWNSHTLFLLWFQWQTNSTNCHGNKIWGHSVYFLYHLSWHGCQYCWLAVSSVARYKAGLAVEQLSTICLYQPLVCSHLKLCMLKLCKGSTWSHNWLCILKFAMYVWHMYELAYNVCWYNCTLCLWVLAWSLILWAESDIDCVSTAFFP